MSNETTKAEVEQINKKRKFEQVSSGLQDHLMTLEAQRDKNDLLALEILKRQRV
jgi:hypothetical protein